MTDDLLIKLRDLIRDEFQSALKECAPPAAGSAAEVEAVVRRSVTSRASGDLLMFSRAYAPNATCFHRRGSPLAPVGSIAERKALYEAGYRADVNIRDIRVHVLSADAAYATAVTEGSVTNPDGSVEDGPWRYTAVLQRFDGVWAIVHVACSPQRN
jgi:uncharacterized protein (TIGR02246 family)